MYYNYVYLDPRKPGNFGFESVCFLFEPLYVGKGKSNRCYIHLKNSKRIDNPIFRTKLNLLKQNFDLMNYIVQLNFTEDENLSYFNESRLIEEIGSSHIKEIKDGPLVNICLENRPPSLKGKTYKEIYGDKYEEQIEKRRKLQLEIGGYFSGKKHTQESKNKISESQVGDKNHMYGKKHSEETLKKMSLKKKGIFDGNKNPNAKRYRIVSPTQQEFLIEGTLKSFCIENELSYSTLTKTLRTGKKVSHGKTKGWILEYVN
jgi:hypothetical protein